MLFHLDNAINLQENTTDLKKLKYNSLKYIFYIVIFWTNVNILQLSHQNNERYVNIL